MGSKKQNIIFSANTDEFDKNIKEASNSIKTLNSELKLTQSQLKGNSNNIETLRSKLELLKSKYEEQSKVVENTKKKYEEAVEVYGENSTEAQNLNRRLLEQQTIQQNIANEINLTNKSIEAQTNHFITLGKRMTEDRNNISFVGEKITTVGNSMTKVSAVATAGIVAAGKSAIDFESAWTGVTKTVDGTTEQLKTLRSGILDLSTELPSSAVSIANVAESAGQLGIQTDNILSFSKAMIDLGNSTNLTADEAATQLARFANITEMSQKDFDKLGSAVVDLGNNYATTEADIVSMAMRIAGAGHQVKLSEGEILGLATALSSVGIEAEMGGSAISKAMIKMQNAVELGGDKLNSVLKKTGMSLRSLELMAANDSKGFKELAQGIGMTSTEVKQLITAGTNLEDFAKVSGMSAKEFQKAWKDDAAGALSAFIQGLGHAEDKGESAIGMLTEMGLTEVRLRDSLLRAANAGDLFTGAIEKGNTAWDENVALTNEANKRYETTESKMKTLGNKVKKIAISMGEELLPTLNNTVNAAKPVLDSITNGIKKFNELDQSTKTSILRFTAFAIASGPVVSGVGRITSGIGNTISAIGTFNSAIGTMKTGIESANTTANTLAKILGAVTSTAGLTTIGLTTLIGVVSVVATATAKSNEQIKTSLDNVANGATNFTNGISSAKSHLDEFNLTMFASSEQQAQLQANMQLVQDGITNICRTATEERRNYTAEEITQLETYFQRLNDLQIEEMNSQMAVSGAIITQSKLNIQNFSGNIDEFKVQAQEWLNTSIEQKDNIVKLAEEQCTTKIALLEQQYASEGRARDENYNNTVQKAYEQKQAMVDAANQQVAEVSLAYTQGYQNLGTAQDGFFTKYQETNLRVEGENQRHENTLKSIQDNAFLTQSNKQASIEQENYRHENELKKIWKQMYKDLDETQEEQLGTWIAMCAQTELYGGEMDEESKKAVTNISATWDELPPKTTKSMTDAMQGMLNGMSEKEPELYAKAQGIANNIINIINSAFQIGSPSRLMRKTFAYVIEGGEEGLEQRKEKLFSLTEKIAEGVKDRLNISSLMDNLKNNYDLLNTDLSSRSIGVDSSLIPHVSDNILNRLNSKTIIVNFYPQKMTDEEIDRAADKIREDWGAELV